MPTSFLIALFDSMAPHSARTLLKSLRSFMTWCVEHKLMRSNPTLGIKLKVPRSDGFHTWSEPEIAAFEAHHPVGSRARLAFALGLYTAQRRGDVVHIGRQHIRDGVLGVRQRKTGASLSIPVHPELKEIIAATPIGHLKRLHRAVSPLVRCRRPAAGMLIPWVAKSRLPQVGGSRMQRARDRCHQRTQDVEGGRALHQGG